MKTFLKKIAGHLFPKRSVHESLEWSGTVLTMDDDFSPELEESQHTPEQVKLVRSLEEDLEEAAVEWSPEGKIQKIGHFAIIEELGKGADGIVYKVFDESLDRELALKLMISYPKSAHPSRAYDDLLKTLHRYHQEILIQAQLRGRGVKEIHTAGWIANPQDQLGMSLYFVMPLSEQSLHGMEKKIARMTPEEMLEEMSHFEDVIEALGFLHEQGYLFHDVKPANILRHESGIYQIADFGMAMEMTDEPLDRTQTRGTILFHPPEKFQAIASSAVIGPEADWYSLTLTMYFLLSQGETHIDPKQHIMEILREMLLLQRDEKAARDFLDTIEETLDEAGVTPHLMAFVRKGLEPRIQDRHADYLEAFREALRLDRQLLKADRRERDLIAERRAVFAEFFQEDQQESGSHQDEASSDEFVWAPKASMKSVPTKEKPQRQDSERVRERLEEIRHELKLIPNLLNNIDRQRKKSDEARVSDIQAIGDDRSESKYAEVFRMYDIQEEALKEKARLLKIQKKELEDELKSIDQAA